MMKNDRNTLFHDSALKHVSGEAIYINDIPEEGTYLYGHVVFANLPSAEILEIETCEAKKVRGVHAVLTWKDIPGQNQMGPVIHDEPCLVQSKIKGYGQAILLIAAENRKIALEAEKMIVIRYKELQSIPNIESAMAKQSLIAPSRKIEKGNIERELPLCPHVISGSLFTGAQEHWYLETQTAYCFPGEDDEITAYVSTQNPSETQAIVAEVLGISKNKVVCEVRRLGGAFGGKETQANHVAAWAALLARATKKPVMIHLFRDDDQKYTGKRHPFLSYFTIGFDRNGKIHAYSVELNADAGHSTDLSMAILERAMLHAENAYFIPNVRIIGNAWRTNNASNTAFRGFGGPQGMAVIEYAIEKIAAYLGKDPAKVRKINFYGKSGFDQTPYGQKIEGNRLGTLFSKLIKSSDYYSRKNEIDQFNLHSEYIKKGIALSPVKFGISFTTSFLNQAGALVHIYADGSVQVNHGGTEMGQGLNTKMLVVASEELGISPEKIVICPANTSKVPNTSATAASSGSDLNGMAVKNAIDKLKKRLAPVAIMLIKSENPQLKLSLNRIIFSSNKVYDHRFPDHSITFQNLVAYAYRNQISLSSTGYYRTPGIFFDREKGQGKPFHYFAYGMAVSETETDLLTGRVKVNRVDILHDTGLSIHSMIDKGQVCGAFVQGLGWILTEEVRYDTDGRLLTYSPDTYKIPTIKDIPEIFNISLLDNAANPNTIKKSKAVGEPPFMLAFSVWLSVRYALSSISNHKRHPELIIPMTYEKIVLEAQKLRSAL